jgi:hypothetical protein
VTQCLAAKPQSRVKRRSHPQDSLENTILGLRDCLDKGHLSSWSDLPSCFSLRNASIWGPFQFARLFKEIISIYVGKLLWSIFVFIIIINSAMFVMGLLLNPGVKLVRELPRA